MTIFIADEGDIIPYSAVSYVVEHYHGGLVGEPMPLDENMFG